MIAAVWVREFVSLSLLELLYERQGLQCMLFLCDGGRRGRWTYFPAYDLPILDYNLPAANRDGVVLRVVEFGIYSVDHQRQYNTSAQNTAGWADMVS